MNRYKIIQCVVAYIAGRSRDEAVEVVVVEILAVAQVAIVATGHVTVCVIKNHSIVQKKIKEKSINIKEET